MRTDHMNSAPTLSTTVSKCLLFFSFFSPDFVTIFALITIFGNAHRPCKHYPNIVHNSLHHVYSFFPLFFLIFWLYLHYLPYLEMCTDHVNNTPTLLTIVNTMSILFFWSYGYIFTNYHIWKCAETMLTLLRHYQQQSASCLFFFCLFLPDFLAMFALIAILGNAHRPHEQCTNIANNSI